MSVQIIKRKEGSLSQKETILGRSQISFNDDGRLVIRCIQSQGEDVLFVLNQASSQNIINYCQEKLKPMARNNSYKCQRCIVDDDIPF